MLGLFRRPGTMEREKAAAIKDIVRDFLGLDEATTISVSEIQCGDASCPGTETVILVMQPGTKTRAYKVMAPLLDVDRNAVEQVLAS